MALSGSDWHFFCFSLSAVIVLLNPHLLDKGVAYEKDGFDFRSLLSFCFCNPIRGTGW
jgi:hypothetical protein